MESETSNNQSSNKTGWRKERTAPSLPENYRSIEVSHQWSWWRKMLGFAGPGYLVAVGYIDPGNWATDLAGGSQFGYKLLYVIFLSNLIAILLQSLAIKLGIATGRDLAQACNDHYSRPISIMLWILCEIAICACDLAEVIGSAIALNLLFNMPLLVGVCVTALDILLIMYLQNLGFRILEAFVITLLLLIAVCFWFEIIFSQPDIAKVMNGFIPTTEILHNSDMLYIAIGILGATVMPHNLYLHSSIVQTRKYADTAEGKKEAIRFVTLDSTVALLFAFLINASILIVAAQTFHAAGYFEVAELQDAYKLLSPLLNEPVASTLFGLALLLSGQNSTLTGTLAGQIVMEGFLEFRMRPWLRRLITRGIAVIPAVICVALYGQSGMNQLLIFSQVLLSFQLGFAVIPLILFTSNRGKMGPFVNSWPIKVISWIAAVVIIIVNVKYVVDFIYP